MLASEMPEQIVAYGGGNLSVGPYLSQTRQECIQLVQANTPHEWNVTACILDKFTQYDNALYASRQYILTLWPAFVGAIVAMAPDPANMVFDNVWWSAIFAVTCSGLPGLDNSASPLHHIEAHSDAEGRALCEAWTFDVLRPKAMSKSYTMGAKTRGDGRVRMEWAAFFLSLGFWIAFIFYFGHTLYPCGNNAFLITGWLSGAIWYYISAAPAVLDCLFELAHNRVELYELVGIEQEVSGPVAPSANEEQKSRRSAEVRELPQQRYQKVKVRSVFSLWLRIVVHQWRRDKYRILIRDAASHRFWWFFLCGKALVGIGRIAVFALGSVSMGSILFMPVPDDLYLFVVLLFTSAVPRQLWPAFWTNGNRGADLVVFIRNIHLGERGINEGPLKNQSEAG